jgi:hypothetical protein
MREAHASRVRRHSLCRIFLNLVRIECFGVVSRKLRHVQPREDNVIAALRLRLRYSSMKPTPVAISATSLQRRNDHEKESAPHV